MTAAPQVLFVGAGPGDPDLLTIRALKALKTAHVILYDALVSDSILELIPRSARRICVGKRAGARCIAQSAINALLVQLAKPGRILVRLKGGDPAIFGRLGEEASALEKAGVSFAIVPGITTASAAAAAACIPLTLRGTARRVQFVTAHVRAGEALDLDWRSLADKSATTVFYMARQSAGEISKRLIENGLNPDISVLLMSDVGLDSEMRLSVRLSELPQAVHRFPPEVPLIILAGEVTSGAIMPHRDTSAADAVRVAGFLGNVR